MILPIGHQETAVRRLPWVTFLLIAACLAALLTIDPEDPGPPTDLQRATEYWVQRAYLEADPEILAAVLHDVPPERQQGVIRSIRYTGLEKEPLDRELVAREQQELDRLTQRALAEIESGVPLYDRNAYTRWGLVPATPSALTFLTHMFVHAGWIHLLGNLFMLFLAGPPIEDRWGRPLFSLFYLLAGLVSGAVFLAATPGSPIPLVGASGAIAGVMGAFFVLCWRARIRFFYLFFVGFRFLRGTFQAPAWLMLPLWFANELLMLWVAESVAVEGGIAYSAHVGGFLFGAAFALLMRATRIEERLIHPAIEAKITTRGNPIVERALEARERGQLQRAYGLLDGALREHPNDPDVVLAYWDTAVASKRLEQALPRLLDRIRDAQAAGDHERAARFWRAVVEEEPEARLEPAALVRLAPALLDLGDRERAVVALGQAVESEDAPLTPGQAFRIVDLARSLDPAIALRAAQRALSDPELPDAKRDRIEALIATLEVVSGATSGEEIGDAGEHEALDARALDPEAFALDPTAEPIVFDDEGDADSGARELPASFDSDSHEESELAPPEAAAVPRFVGVKVVDAIPIRFTETGIALELQGGKRVTLSYDKIDAVAVAAVNGLSSKPVLVLDLIANWNEAGEDPLKLVRLRSDAYDPRDLLPDASRAAEALREMLGRILAASGALALPDGEGAAGRPFPVFEDLAAYQREVLQVA